jgi:hypothetical protein
MTKYAMYKALGVDVINSKQVKCLTSFFRIQVSPVLLLVVELTVS